MNCSMVSGEKQPAKNTELRQHAEAKVSGSPEPSLKELEALSPEATRRLIHELHVHQIELEMQNEELRRAQLAQSVATSSYLDLYDFAPIGYCTVDEQGIILRANLTVAALLGVARGSLAEQPLLKFILDTDRDAYYLHHKQLRASEESRGCEVRLVKPDGTTIWAHLMSVATEDAEGNPRYQIVLSDISERKKRDDTLRLQALVLDQIQDHVTITDLDGVVTYVNQTQARCVELLPEDMVGRHVSAYGRGPLADATQKIIADATLNDGAWHGNVVRHLPDGSQILVDLRTKLIKDEGGKPTAMVGFGTDITERHKLEEALRQSEISNLDILDSLDAEIAVVDRDGLIRAVNEPWRRFALVNGRDPDTPVIGIGANYLAVCEASTNSQSPDSFNVCKKIQAVLDRTLPIFMMDYPCHSPLEQRWFRMSAMPLRRSLEGGCVIAHTNITEQKKAEVALMAAMVETETANHAKSRFLAAASHDLRQPLSALSLYVGALERRVSPDHAELVGSIQDCVVNLSELLTDLLDVSKLDAEVVTPTLSAFSIDNVLADLVSIHSAEAELKGLRLRFRQCGAIGRTDQTLFRRLLGNLLSNAINYTNNGGVLIACRHHQGRLWVEVWDTGVGIAEDQFGVIFDEFRQLGDGARTRGSGLGLAIVDKTAKLLGLKMRLRSRVGRGSMFAVELPRGRALTTDGPVPLRLAARRLRIGLVDDHENLRNALVLALKDSGHDVLGAASGPELLECLGQHAPDIVISDYRLAAGENGYGVIKAVRDAFNQDLPAFLITGDTDPALIRSMADRGIAVYYKPLQMDALQASIRQATERRFS